MSTDLRLASWNDMPKATHDTAHHNFKIRALMPARQNPQSAKPQTSSFATKTLIFVLALHVLALFLVLMLKPEAMLVTEDTSPPMLVSLVESPVINQEFVEPKPVEPKPEPVIKKPTPKPQEKPTPQVQDAPSPIPQAAPQEVAPPPTSASAPVVTKPAEIIEKQQQPIEEPKPEIVTSVSYLKKPELVFPAQSRRLGEEGTVVIRVLVAVNGEPESMEIRKSSGYTRLDQAGLDAVKKARFVPPKKNNKPLSVLVDLPLSFTLTDE
ncbi:hypothetical protein A7981_03785 [Methylovorus sp. MM2]|uniref:TonB family protein n=1 Tax=Methylovorus sp. MM2 TaxID=1848038 RepID=UPI0007E19839|nr:TonB family protein [Methylovorus sp. MM2]OAM52592.1 hypothetical protein A7981_03785 [Methylovorus sp. MM2]